jgi:hypothetical protein
MALKGSRKRRCGPDVAESRQGLEDGFCEQADESYGSIKKGKEPTGCTPVCHCLQAGSSGLCEGQSPQMCGRYAVFPNTHT